MTQTLNALTIQPTARLPRLRVLVNGTASPAAVSFSVTNNNWYQSDTFEVTFADNADPALSASWWADQQIVQLDVRASLDGGKSWTSLIVGNVDDIQWSPDTHLIRATGRDLSSLLIEAPTKEQFVNQTASQVATTLAGRHGLTPVVTATTAQIGRYFEIDHDHTTLGRGHYTTTEWDLLTFLAKVEGFDCYVSGQSLYFQPPTATSALPYAVAVVLSPSYSANVTSLELQHHKTLARAITVEVRSFTSKTGKTVTATATSGGTGAANKYDDATRTQVYRYIFPNLSQQMAQQRATALLTQLKQHERSLTFSAPGDLTLTPRSVVQLSGTGTAFDQTYYADAVTREMSFDGAFMMQVGAKNRDQRGQVSASGAQS